jgi:hypothetical protein
MDAMKYLLLSLFVLFSSPAIADLDEARLAYDEGRWSEAAILAERVEGSDGFALASKALLAQLMVEPDLYNRSAASQRALELAELGYQLDRENPEARVQLAAAIGYRARYMGGFRVYVARLPQRGKRLLDDLLIENPNDPWVVGLLGAWHLEVARRGGSSGMRMLDASVDAGIGLMSNSIALDPYNPAPRYFLALSIIALEDSSRHLMAVEQIEIVLDLEPRDAFEAGIQAEARLLADLLDDKYAAIEWAQNRMTH